MTALMTKARNRPKTIMNSLRATIRPRVSDDEISARKTGAFPIRRRIHEERMFSRELAGYIVVEPCDTTDYEGFTAADRLLGAPGRVPPGSASGIPRCPEKSPSCPGTSGSC